MDFADFQRQVDAFVVQHSRLALPYGIQLLDEELKASDDDLSDVESRLRVRLPTAYKEVMKVYGVGPFVFVELTPVRPSPKRIGDLIRDNTGDFAIAGFLSIAAVGTGDMWGFAVTEGICADAVSFWYHETGQVEFDSEDFLAFLVSRGIRADR